MSQTDSTEFRNLICRLLPGLRIRQVARPSGQRIVYFADFSNFADISDEEKQGWGEVRVEEWGDVVVKASSGISANAITYLQREIRILSVIDSVSYPKMYFDNVYTQDPLTEDHLSGRIFITVEEFVPSKPLSDCFAAFQTEDQVLGILIQLVHALRILWDQKPPLVHRDIKPENILIKDDGSVVVIDLGIVREEGSDGVTHTEWLWGPCTPQFSSPEQARNDKRNISFKSDVFALGILAYVLITGSNPFRPNEDTAVSDVLGNILNFVPKSLNGIARVSHQFSDLVDQMLQKEPYRRPRTPSSLLVSLTKIQDSNNAN